MPIATPTAIRARIVLTQVPCEHCGGPIFSDLGTWLHDYQGPWYGQMICDPQQARAALQGRQPHHATP